MLRQRWWARGSISISCVKEYVVYIRVRAFLAVAVSLVVRENAVASWRSAMMCCDNNDATSNGIQFPYVVICVAVIGGVDVAAYHLSFEIAQLLRRAMLICFDK